MSTNSPVSSPKVRDYWYIMKGLFMDIAISNFSQRGTQLKACFSFFFKYVRLYKVNSMFYITHQIQTYFSKDWSFFGFF